jgi:hypothetical protein
VGSLLIHKSERQNASGIYLPSFSLSISNKIIVDFDTGGIILIAKICSEPKQYLGHVIIIRGFFMGWQVAKCKFCEHAATEPLTRFDWLIQTEDYCVFVTGGMPKGLDPLNPASAGRLVEIEAEIKRTVDDKIYFVYRRGTVVS